MDRRGVDTLFDAIVPLGFADRDYRSNARTGPLVSKNWLAVAGFCRLLLVEFCLFWCDFGLSYDLDKAKIAFSG